MYRKIRIRMTRIDLPVVLDLALAVCVATSSAGASTYCPPKGPGAPTYCDNIPHKDKRVPSKRDPSKVKQQFQQDDARKSTNDEQRMDKH